MEPGEIRPIAICVLRDEDKIFVGRYVDPSTGETFFRPLGGAIRFGERSRECVVRELREEMGGEVKDLTFVGTLENMFTYDAKSGHEIVLIYQADFEDPGFYGAASVRCRDDDGVFLAYWIPLADFETDQAILYPEGLLDLLVSAEAALGRVSDFA
jgi:ADP-ribose pyrophosphatase YjhB (NUDIX family)